MKLTKIAILGLRGSGKEIKEKIAKELGVHIATVYSWVEDNADNSKLTLASIVKIISEETGLEPDQILEETETAQSEKAA
jgi:hypothetical protein